MSRGSSDTAHVDSVSHGLGVGSVSRGGGGTSSHEGGGSSSRGGGGSFRGCSHRGGGVNGYSDNPPTLDGLGRCPHCFCNPCVIASPPTFLVGSATAHIRNAHKRFPLY